MKIFFHDDFDGRAAAFCVHAWACLALGREAEFIPMHYDGPFPLETIQDKEDIWIVDYSIEPWEMKDILRKTPNVTWIDHHISAIEKYKNFSLPIPGIRKDGTAACALTWQFLQPESEVPLPIKLIADRDVWTWEYGEMTAKFFAGLGCYDTSPQSPIWWKLLGKYLLPRVTVDIFDQVISDGEVVLRYQEKWYEEFRDCISFEVNFEGHKCLAINLPKVGTEVFGGELGKLPDSHDMFIIFYYEGEKFRISLYSECIDVSEIAIHYGGGGHKHSASFFATKLPFEEI